LLRSSGGPALQDPVILLAVLLGTDHGKRPVELHVDLAAGLALVRAIVEEHGGTVIVAAPVILMFVVSQRSFIRDMATGAVKE
jgi:ABC-type maltose transport system permease subunit